MQVTTRMVFRTTLSMLVLTAALAVNASAQSINLSVLGEYKTGVFDESAAEIVAHDPATQRLFTVRGEAPEVDIISIANPASPVYVTTIDFAAIWSAAGGANSIDVHNGIVAVAVQADPKTDPGRVYFLQASTGAVLHYVTVGALPDMLTFSEDGQYVLVANEGEPNDSYTIDPEGSVSVIDLSSGVASASVATADFHSFDAQKAALMAAGVRIFGDNNPTVSQDLEPEYITTKGDMAWVGLQENNALAVVQISTATVQGIVPLGFKDHSLAGNGFDPSDKDGIDIGTWPVRGMYMPDAIASVKINGTTYIVSANEGDAREYEDEDLNYLFAEEERVKDLTLDPTAFPNAVTLQGNNDLGRLNVTTTLGDTDNDGDYDELYSFGARSFSIWDTAGNLVWDSGDQFEQITAAAYPADFNTDNDENDPDGRSDAKGPEPEALTVATICGSTYAFIGLERIGGIMVYDISDPTAPVFQQYINNRDFALEPENNVNTVGDLGPEGLIFIDAADSPNGQNLLVCASEVSGTVTLFSVLNTDAPVLDAALDLVNLINATKGDFEVNITATDGCDPEPMVHAVIEIPATDGNTVIKYNMASLPRLKFDPAKNTVTVDAPNPQQFWTDILAAGGIPVVDGDVLEYDLIPSYTKFDYDFMTDGTLVKVKAAVDPVMMVAATDASNMTTTESATASFAAPKLAANAVPSSPVLHQNHPNPFNPSTVIRFTLPEAGAVTLAVHDLLGRHVATLVDGAMAEGTHSVRWNGSNANGIAVPSGVYLYTLRSGAKVETRRMMLMK
ncbi:MAG: choice-of-anchor I family protein [Bacteroidetes bacterium]|nr:choice-of-anchor I family protein [Bacteroidota bacterium]